MKNTGGGIIADAGDGPCDRSKDIRLVPKSLFLRFRTSIFKIRRFTFEISSFLRSFRFRVSDEVFLLPDLLVLGFRVFRNDSTLFALFSASFSREGCFLLITRLGFIQKTYSEGDAVESSDNRCRCIEW